jgi:hypothetical protein
MFPGDHFFLQSASAPLVESIGAILSAPSPTGQLDSQCGTATTPATMVVGATGQRVGTPAISAGIGALNAS